jgi:hypothetical protein
MKRTFPIVSMTAVGLLVLIGFRATAAEDTIMHKAFYFDTQAKCGIDPNVGFCSRADGRISTIKLTGNPYSHGFDLAINGAVQPQAKGITGSELIVAKFRVDERDAQPVVISHLKASTDAYPISEHIAIESGFALRDITSVCLQVMTQLGPVSNDHCTPVDQE